MLAILIALVLHPEYLGFFFFFFVYVLLPVKQFHKDKDSVHLIQSYVPFFQYITWNGTTTFIH